MNFLISGFLQKFEFSFIQRLFTWLKLQGLVLLSAFSFLFIFGCHGTTKKPSSNLESVSSSNASHQNTSQYSRRVSAERVMTAASDSPVLDESTIPSEGPYLRINSTSPVVRPITLDANEQFWKNPIPFVVGSETGLNATTLEISRFDSILPELNWAQAHWVMVGQELRQPLVADLDVMSRSQTAGQNVSLHFPDHSNEGAALDGYILEVPSRPGAVHHGLKLQFRFPAKLPKITLIELKAADTHLWVKPARHLRAQSVGVLKLENYQRFPISFNFLQNPRLQIKRLFQSQTFEFHRPEGSLSTSGILGGDLGCSIQGNRNRWAENVSGEFLWLINSAVGQREILLEQFIANAGSDRLQSNAFSDSLHLNPTTVSIQPGQVKEYVLYFIQSTEQLHAQYRGPCAAEPVRILPTTCVESCTLAVPEATARACGLLTSDGTPGRVMQENSDLSCIGGQHAALASAGNGFCARGRSITPAAPQPFSDSSDVLGTVVSLNNWLENSIPVVYSDLPRLSTQLEHAQTWEYAGQSLLRIAPQDSRPPIDLSELPQVRTQESSTFCSIPYGI